MKGEATPEYFYELENFFNINRDNAKIKQISKDVEDYEEPSKRQLLSMNKPEFANKK
ncbi:MAG: hypothetical protein RR365_11620 [Bacteroides sp.]